MARFTLPRDLYHGKGALEALKSFTGKKAMICVGGGYDQDLGCWFDLELFQLSDEEVSLLSEWLNAKSVTAVFVGRDGTTQSYALTKENRTAIQEMVTAYNLMLSSTVEQCDSILTSLAK